MRRRGCADAVCGIALVLLMAGGSAWAAPLGTAFSYQGRLWDGGVLPTGSYDLQFRLYDAATGGTQQGTTVTVEDVAVVGGLFTVSLDYGQAIFNNQARWLQVAVRPGASVGAFTVLSPRQVVTATPYALQTRGLYVDSSLNVGLGTTAPAGKLDIRNGNLLINSSTGHVELGYTPNGDRWVFNTSGGGQNLQFVEQPEGGSSLTRVFFRSGGDVGIGTTSPQAKLHVAGLARFDAGSGQVSVATPGGWPGVIAYSPNGHRRDIIFSDTATRLLVGPTNAAPTTNYGITIDEEGDLGIGASAGTRIRLDSISTEAVPCPPSGAYYGAAVRGYRSVDCFAMLGYERRSGDCDFPQYRGVYGQVTPAYGYAGFFSGNVYVSGTVTKGGGAFKIDHPLDPENKYLYHSFVESPDMKNIYDGVVTTDGTGYATVTLPDWFEALNRDFRYQLTVIGEFAQAIVAQKIQNNAFVIRTDKPNVEVSWQVTGIRQDAWANANRVPVEQDKDPAERGQYLHPEAWGQHEMMGVHYAGPLELEAGAD